MAAILLASSLDGGGTCLKDLKRRAPTDSAGADLGRADLSVPGSIDLPSGADAAARPLAAANAAEFNLELCTLAEVTSSSTI